MTRQAIVGHMCLQSALGNGVFQFRSCSKEIIIYFVSKKSNGAVGTSPQQCFYNLWSIPIKRNKMWAKWPVRKISTGNKIALTKSETEAYLLFTPPIFFSTHSEWHWNIKKRNYSIQVSGLLKNFKLCYQPE